MEANDGNYVNMVSFSRSNLSPVTPVLRPGYDLGATEKCWNRGQIVERTHDCSQRSWVIAKAKSVAGSKLDGERSWPSG